LIIFVGGYSFKFMLMELIAPSFGNKLSITDRCFRRLAGTHE